MDLEPLFQSFFMAGWECSCHHRCGGRKRLDLIAASQHDRFARRDFERLGEIGIRSARDGVRWHRVEGRAGDFRWDSVLPMVRAARDAGVQVVWDLCHWGWPDTLAIWSPEWPERFAKFAAAFAALHRDEVAAIPFYAPVNEISFWAWAGGSVGYLNPCARDRGNELKAQLVRATIAAIDRVREVDPRARFVQPEPAIHVLPDPELPDSVAAAERHRRSQFEAWDMLRGSIRPELGGHPRYLDVLGINFYPVNQWVLDGPKIGRGEPRYRPFREMLAEVHRRYGRPLLVAETGAEGEERHGWLRYVCDEVAAAVDSAVPISAVCWYPIADHPGWDDARHCPNGLFGYPDAAGERPLFEPLAAELRRQQERFARVAS